MSNRLWFLLEQARNCPQAADFEAIWLCLQATLETLPLEAQLLTSAEALTQMAQIVKLKSEQLLQDWEQRHSQEGPVVPEECFSGLVRSTVRLDLDDLIESPQPPLRTPRLKRNPNDSVAAVVDKSRVLSLSERLASSAALSEAENPNRWLEVISQGLQGRSLPVSLTSLQQQLGIPLVELWLGLLLGGFSLQQQGDFYQTETIWIVAD